MLVDNYAVLGAAVSGKTSILGILISSLGTNQSGQVKELAEQKDWSWRRLDKLNFRRILETWNFAVRSEIASRCAIAWFDTFCCISSRIWVSRRVRLWWEV